MSTTNLIQTIESLREWEALQSEAAAMVESIKDTIKREMDVRGIETLEAGPYIARYTSVQSSRFNTKLFKETMGADVYKRFCKETLSRRFTVSG